jgi:Tol biopolymer transport system component
VPATGQVAAVDWAPTGDVLVFSAAGEGGIEDLFRADPNGANNRNLTSSSAVRERGGRVDRTGSVAVYERIEQGAKPAVFVFVDQTRQVRITTPADGTETLAGTPYVVGSDADPAFSPDGQTIVFRRLTSAAGPLGTWSIMTVRTDLTALTVVAGGADYRGAPDWGPSGIVFEEADGTSGARRLVAVQPDGSGRRVLVPAPLARSAVARRTGPARRGCALLSHPKTSVASYSLWRRQRSAMLSTVASPRSAYGWS